MKMMTDRSNHSTAESTEPLREAIRAFRSLAPAVDFWSLRLVDQRTERLGVRQNTTEPPLNRHSLGAHVTVCDRGGAGYAATCDITRSGLLQALRQARDWARATAGTALVADHEHALPQQSGIYHPPLEQPWESVAFEEKQALLHHINQQLESHASIVDWWARLEHRTEHVALVTADVEINQTFATITPALAAVANRGSETQMRSFGSERLAQAGIEHLLRIDFEPAAARVTEEAVQLLDAPNCPSGPSDLLLMPDQMALQIHETIGHPLELDRILGDERNYAGTSFVTRDMFGTYRYGSELLNVVFDPRRTTQVAAYRFDDEGTAATPQHLIRHGILLRPLGGRTSQQRAGLDGVANSRSCSWNRPPIDRMGNINVEPGDRSLEQMIASIERGILMHTNRSWSIDDSRNKFQFGCEIGWRIENGECTTMLKNPNYRGISATFWRNLAAVGDTAADTICGVSTCGKGEPNQAIAVGHASPPCLFNAVDVFGGAA